MAEITASMVKEVRERTGLGMMDCKKALSEAAGDMEKAIEILRKASGAKAARKAGRTAADGVVRAMVAEDGSAGVVVEVNSETDFAARDDNFVAFADSVVQAAFDAKSGDVASLLDAGLEVQREALVQKIGENISVRRGIWVEPEGATVASYVHNGKIAVLIAVEGGDPVLARDIAMHVAATKPMVVHPDDVPADVVASERAIYEAQAADSGKPAEIVAKMVDGRVRKYLAEVSLVEQPFVKDPNVKVSSLLKDAGASIRQMVRYEVGEGIEIEETDFAAEVAAQLGQG